jgi:hypothetical protein
MARHTRIPQSILSQIRAISQRFSVGFEEGEKILVGYDSV